MRRRLTILLATFACAPVAAPAAHAATGGVAAPIRVIVADGGVSPVPPPTATTQATTTTHHPAPSSGSPTGLGRADVPPEYRRFYGSAARSYGLDWRLLAAIGKVESDHGRSTARGVQSGLNFAHCCAGPMQICRVSSCGNAWAHYGIDADGDGIVSAYEPADAIYAAAAMLRDIEGLVGSRPKLVLASYNAGAGRVLHYRGVPPFAETRTYVARALRYMASLRG